MKSEIDDLLKNERVSRLSWLLAASDVVGLLATGTLCYGYVEVAIQGTLGCRNKWR